MRRIHALSLIAASLVAQSAVAQDKGNLNIYCSMQIEWCTLAANEFSKQTGIKVNTSPAILCSHCPFFHNGQFAFLL